MYLPKYFAQKDSAKVRKLIEQNSFATVLSFPQTEPVYVNHLPIIFSSCAGEEEILIGHMAKQNPQWRHFQENPKSTLIFHGAHTYITPTWYTSGNDVPTWNYAVAHLHGKMELIEPYEQQIAILKQLAYVFEKSNPNPWTFELPPDLADENVLVSSIVSFKFYMEKIDTKFKLSQNRSAEDRQAVIAGLLERKDEMSHLVRELMLEEENNPR